MDIADDCQKIRFVVNGLTLEALLEQVSHTSRFCVKPSRITTG